MLLSDSADLLLQVQAEEEIHEDRHEADSEEDPHHHEEVIREEVHEVDLHSVDEDAQEVDEAEDFPAHTSTLLDSLTKLS